jgi:putative transposase
MQIPSQDPEASMTSYIEKLLSELFRNMLGVEMKEIGFDRDHLHGVIEIPPKYRISDVRGKLKSQSSSRLRKKFTWFEKVYWDDNIVWSPGYFVSSIGRDEKTIQEYVRHQGEQDLGQFLKDL